MCRHAFRIEQLEHRLLLANDPIVVDTAEDIIADDGVTSLREAIIEANATIGADVIQFAEFRRGRPIKFARGGMGENEAVTGDLDITDDLTIAGRGADETIIDANRLDRVFHIHGDITVILSGMTIRGGQIGGGNGSGGGILNQGSLSILESVITDNTASYTGGAVFNRGTIKSIAQSTISGNTASHAAGAIENSGTIESISQSIISGNTAGHEAGAIENYGVIESISQTTFSDNTSDSAGAIENYGTITSISQSTFSGNTASRKGGAIENYESIGSISQTTFSGNTAPGGGSAIENYGSIGSISQSTITGNSLDGGVAILQHSRGTIVSLENTIIAGNGNGSDRYGRRDLSGGEITISRNNLIGAISGHTITSGIDGNIVGVDPMLGPLADHGGPTFTHAPLPDSPAIDAGSLVGGLGFDQRGAPFIRFSGGHMDIGALEMQQRIEPIIVDTVRDVMDDDDSMSLREAILEANATVGPDTIMFAESLDGRAITLSILGTDEDATLTGDLDITDDLTIVGGGLENTILNANEIDRVLELHGDIAVTIFGVTITGGQTNNRGGGISNRGARLSLIESKISGNRAESMGGGIINAGTIGSLYRTTLADNEARYGGGLGNFGTIESIHQSTFSGNTASRAGGAIENRGTIEQMNQSTISGNSSSDGGAIRNHGTIDNISQMTFTGNSSFDDGGAIQNYDTIGSISQSTFSGNVASGDGGAIKNYDTIGDISQSTFSGNVASGDGGAIQNYGTIESISQATFSGNMASGDGGAIENYDAIDSINLTTFAGNSASDDAGAIQNYGSIGNISQTTISGNSAAGVGGAIKNYGSINRISQSTITGNTADRNPGILSSGPIRTLESTIIAGNSDTNGSEGSDLSGGRDITARNNLIGTSSGHAIRNDRAGNIVGVDPRLGPLADHGGATLTHALLPGSPAIDVGNNRDLFDFDQRGAPFRRIMGQGADIGAFEYVTPIVVDTDLDVIADDGVTSLREAIIEANTSIGADAIRFEESSRPKIFELSIRGTGENAAASGDLDITDDLSIEGHGARKTIIDADGIDRVFELHGDIAVTISGVTIRGGQTNSDGGGIRNQDARLSIYDSAIVQNWAAHAAGGIENLGTIEVISQTSFTDNVAMFGGGVIANEGAIGDITRTTFLRNSSNHSGGAIENFGTIDAIEQTTFSENTSSFGGGAINNFGIMNHLNGTTFSGNSANHDGGAIENSGMIGSISLTTISNNTAAGEAGAIENIGVIKSISHSTITGNTAQRGAAILQHSNGIIGQLQNTIIAGNSNGGGSGVDDLENNGTITSSVSNLIGSSQGHTIRDGERGNIVGADPMLGPLADNGGPTLTHALLPGSPAIDPNRNRTLFAFDQRGEPFVREYGRTADIGAFEWQPGPVVVMPFTEQDLREAMLSIVGEPNYLVGLDFDGSGMIDIRDLQLFRTPQVVSPPDEDPYSDLYALENSKSDTDLRTAHEHVFASIADGELTPLLPLSGLER